MCPSRQGGEVRRPSADSINDAVVALSDSTQARTPKELAHDRGAANQSGLYAWWADAEAVKMLSAVLGGHTQPLVYIGQAGATRFPSWCPGASADARAGRAPRPSAAGAGAPAAPASPQGRGGGSAPPPLRRRCARTCRRSCCSASGPTACSAGGGWTRWPASSSPPSPSRRAGRRGRAATSAPADGVHDLRQQGATPVSWRGARRPGSALIREARTPVGLPTARTVRTAMGRGQ